DAMESPKPRHELWHSSAVARVVLWEGRHKELLFTAQLALEQHDADREDHERSSEPGDEDRSEQHPEEAGIDRMTRHAVRAVGPKLVVVLDHRRDAPHRAERGASPQRERRRADENGQAEHLDPR